MVSKKTSIIEKLKELSSKIEYAANLIPLDSPESSQLVSNMPSKAQEVMNALSKCYEAQISGAFCGIASAAICLKYLFSTDPAKVQEFTQKALYDSYVKHKLWKTKEDVMYGLNLSQIASVISAAGGSQVNVKTIQIPDVTELENAFKNELQSTFNPLPSTPPKGIIINFYRSYKEHRGGHFCPIGGFSQLKGVDYVYILDVAAHRAKPHWFPLKQLVPLMCRFDYKSPRGYIIVSKALSHIH